MAVTVPRFARSDSKTTRPPRSRGSRGVQFARQYRCVRSDNQPEAPCNTSKSVPGSARQPPACWQPPHAPGICKGPRDASIILRQPRTINRWLHRTIYSDFLFCSVDLNDSLQPAVLPTGLHFPPPPAARQHAMLSW